MKGELHRAGNSSEPSLQIERLDMRRSPTVLAAAAAMLPTNGELALTIDDVRYAERSLGAVQATLTRQEEGLGFSLESLQTAQHQLAAQGRCVSGEARCRVEFTADTEHLAALLRGVELPAEWPTETLHAAGELSWPPIRRATTGARARRAASTSRPRVPTAATSSSASATLADGQISSPTSRAPDPEADQVFRGTGRVACWRATTT